MNATTVVFAFAGDLWSVAREGGSAARLTTSVGSESNPFFSPDGKTIAFTGQYDGNTDVFVMPAEGGEPKRLTAHPGADAVVGWTPDGSAVLFSSSMLSNTDYPRLFTVATTGGVPKPLPFPAGVQGALSPDGTRIAYVPNGKWQQAWKRYRGGQASPVWVAQLSDSKWKAIPRGDEDCQDPMWIGNAIFYRTDPNGIMGLNRYDAASGKVSVAIKGEGFDIKSATAGPDGIVYEKLGSVWIYDTAKKTSTRVPVSIKGDFPEVRTEFKDLSDSIETVRISPTGQRVVGVARGRVFTAPAEKGDVRMMEGVQGVHRRDPTWSPNGATLAYITDEDERQELALFDIATGKERRVAFGEAPSYYYHPVWSPDSTKIAYTDVRLNLWIFDVATGANTKVDTGTYRGGTTIVPAWSPDSKWLTYNKDGDNHLESVYLYEVATGKGAAITDGLALATAPVFDRDGKHLYFLASTDVGVGSDTQDIANNNSRPPTSAVYAVVLKRGGANPLQPESDEEPIKGDAPPAKGEDATGVVDLEGIEGRIIALPLPTRTYASIVPGPAGSLFVLGGGTVTKFSFKDRKPTPYASGVFDAELSADGKSLLLAQPGGYAIAAGGAPNAQGADAIDFSGVRAKIDPQAEWRRMFNEIWRNERMLFYAPNLHGIDAAAMEKRYAPFLANVASRDDLNYLITDMVGELSVGHMWARGGDMTGIRNYVPGGLLGADYAFENGRYRLTRVYTGERWNPGLYAPLAQPSVEAKAGEYILAIDGKELTDELDIYEVLEGKAGKQVRVKIGSTPDGKDAREVTVLPVANEFSLRFRAWGEDNRRKVAELTGGKIGYVHVPDTGGGGWREFNRYFYAQQDKQGLVVDDRFNHGGLVADFFVREMVKPVVYGSRTRYGKDWTIPPSGVYGPKVMLINEMAGSGGDIFPHLFRLHDAGKLVGKRTWGAMISSYGFPLLDGGSVNAPDDALYDPVKGEWVIEGYGTPPDIEVELDPYLWRQGRDAQLEAAVAQVMKELPKWKRPLQKRPDYPDKSKVGKN